MIGRSLLLSPQTTRTVLSSNGWVAQVPSRVCVAAAGPLASVAHSTATPRRDGSGGWPSGKADSWFSAKGGDAGADAQLLAALGGASAPAPDVQAACITALQRMHHAPGLSFKHATTRGALRTLLEAMSASIEAHPAAWRAPTLGRLASVVTGFAVTALPRQAAEYLAAPNTRRFLRASVLAFLPQIHQVPPALVVGMAASLVRADVPFTPLFKAVAAWIPHADDAEWSAALQLKADGPGCSAAAVFRWSEALDPEGVWSGRAADLRHDGWPSPLKSTPPEALAQLLWVFTRPGVLGCSAAAERDMLAPLFVTLLRRMAPHLRALDDAVCGMRPPEIVSASPLKDAVSEHDYSWWRKRAAGEAAGDHADAGSNPAAGPGRLDRTLTVDRIPQLLQCLSAISVEDRTTQGSLAALLTDATALCLRILSHTAASEGPMWAADFLPKTGGRSGLGGDVASVASRPSSHLRARHVVSALHSIAAMELVDTEAGCAAANTLLDMAHRLLASQAGSEAAQELAREQLGGADAHVTHIVSALKPAEVSTLLTACANIMACVGDAHMLDGGRVYVPWESVLPSCLSVRDEGLRGGSYAAQAGAAASTRAAQLAVRQAASLTFHLAKDATLTHFTLARGAQRPSADAQATALCAYATAGAALAPVAAQLCKMVASLPVGKPAHQARRADDAAAPSASALVDIAWGLAASLNPDWEGVAGRGADGRGPVLLAAESVPAVPKPPAVGIEASIGVGVTAVPASSIRGAVAGITVACAEAVRDGSMAMPAVSQLLWAAAVADVYPEPLVDALCARLGLADRGSPAVAALSALPFDLLDHMGTSTAMLAARPMPAGATAGPSARRLLRGLSVALQGAGSSTTIATTALATLEDRSGRASERTALTGTPVVPWPGVAPARTEGEQLAWVLTSAAPEGWNGGAGVWADCWPGPPFPPSMRVPFMLPATRLAFTFAPGEEGGRPPPPTLDVAPLRPSGQGREEAGLEAAAARATRMRFARDLLAASGWRVVTLSPTALRGAAGVRAKARYVVSAFERPSL